MKEVILQCPKCGHKFELKNYLVWMIVAPMHWFGKRYTKCYLCGKRSWMKKEK